MAFAQTFRELRIFAVSKPTTYWIYGDDAFLGYVEDLEFQSSPIFASMYRELYVSSTTLFGRKYQELYIKGSAITSHNRSLYIVGSFASINFYRELLIKSQSFSRSYRELIILGTDDKTTYWWYGSDHFLGFVEDVEFQGHWLDWDNRQLYIFGISGFNSKYTDIYLRGLSGSLNYRQIYIRATSFGRQARELYISGVNVVINRLYKELYVRGIYAGVKQGHIKEYVRSSYIKERNLTGKRS